LLCKKENHCVQKLEVALTQILTRKIARLVLANIVRSHADGNRLVAELQFTITALARYGVPAEMVARLRGAKGFQNLRTESRSAASISA